MNFSAFFGILLNKDKAQLWTPANSGQLVANSKIDEFKAETDQFKSAAEKAPAAAE